VLSCFRGDFLAVLNQRGRSTSFLSRVGRTCRFRALALQRASPTLA